MKIFVTGIAGMIGFHAAKRFHVDGWTVTGIDNFNDYYDVNLKFDRSKLLRNEFGIECHSGDVIDPKTYERFMKEADVVLHLAAYANPRHALEEPQPYIDTNITGTQRLIELAEKHAKPVVYASSSCVMHGQPLPWNEHDRPGHQNNPYGWSKRANECQFMHSNVPLSIGLRFFTVYGPYGRPDMALFQFTDAIVKGKPLTVYNYGDMKRDFTYVEDIIDGVRIVVDDVFNVNRKVQHDIYNIGYGEQVNLLDFIREIEKNLGREAKLDLVPPHPADVPETWSDTTKLQQLGYNPTTPIAEGVEKFVNWYKSYYGVN